jgi:hypothetical protein
MLVKFTCEAYSDITMFGEVAKRLLALMGHSGTIPGAILAEDVPAALERLRSGIESEEAAPASDAAAHQSDDESHEPAVSLKHRAMPLVELLAAAAAQHCHVMWS